MPYVNVKILDQGVSDAKKSELIRAITDAVSHVLDKDPKATIVVIDEIAKANWGSGGQSIADREAATA